MSREKFDNFHEEVLNLPRESFNINEVKIRGLAEYLFAIKESIPPGGLSFPKIYNALHLYLRDSDIVNPNPSFESLFNLNLSELRSIETHWMAVALFLGLIRNAGSKKIISEFTKEINNISSNDLITRIRDYVLEINTLDNDFLINLKTKDFYKDLDFKPAIAILNYLYKSQRECTKFELSIFFGHPDTSLNSEDKIVDAALEIGRKFPMAQKEQEQHYFNLRGWIDESGITYQYKSSQQSYFKFNYIFVVMEFVGLIIIDHNQISLTDYSKSLLSKKQEKRSTKVKKMTGLIDEIDAKDSNEDIAIELINNNPEYISELFQRNPHFIEKSNLKASHQSGSVQSQSTSGIKFKRNKLIVEISKMQASYMCQGCNAPTFINNNNKNHVESHHIIEYNKTEEGPDVLQNLLVLCPNCHSKIHFSNPNITPLFYKELREKNIITLDQFKEIHTKFSMLKIKHIQILIDKEIINNIEKIELLDFINN